jgi:hypothetical protein
MRMMLPLALMVLAVASPLSGEPLSVRARMSPKEQIRVDLPTPQKHFVLFVRREGTASGAESRPCWAACRNDGGSPPRGRPRGSGA